MGCSNSRAHAGPPYGAPKTIDQTIADAETNVKTANKPLTQDQSEKLPVEPTPEQVAPATPPVAQTSNVSEKSQQVPATTQEEDTTTQEEEEFPEDPLKGIDMEIPADAEWTDLMNGVKYRGEWGKGGRQEGKGELSFPNGDSFVGQFKEGKSHGKGQFKSKNGVYTGDFVNGKATGYGRYDFADGSVFLGTFQDDKRQGRGKEIQKSGIQYVGEFINGIKKGYGELTSQNGDVYKGDFSGSMSGLGIYTWGQQPGKVYFGEFRNGKPEGKGELFYNGLTGMHYIGDFQQKAHGEGVLTYPDGRRYAGPFVQATPNGWGKFWLNRSTYKEAQFLNGVRIKWKGDDVQEEQQDLRGTGPMGVEKVAQHFGVDAAIFGKPLGVGEGVAQPSAPEDLGASADV